MSKTIKDETKLENHQDTGIRIGALCCPEIDSTWYKAVIQSSPEGFLLIRHPGGDIIDVNDALCNMLGYSHDELLSMNIEDIEVGFDTSLDSIKNRITDIEAARIASFETRHRCKDGKIIDVAVSIRYLEEGLSFCFHRNITEQKRKQEKTEREQVKKLQKELESRKLAEAALKKSEERYHTLFENAPLAISEIDFSGAKAIIDDLKKKGVKDFKEYFNNNPETLYQCYSIQKSSFSNPKHFEIKGANNVNEMGSCLKDAFNNKNEYWEACKRTMVDLAEGRTRLTRETQVNTIKGEIMKTQEHIIVAPGHEDTLSKVFIYYFDITDLKNKERELREYQEHLENKVEERTATLREEIERRIEYTKLLVHELKTPLTPMLAASEVLTHQQNGEFKVISQNLYEGACALNKRIDELLDIARGEIGMLSINPEPCDIIKVVRKISDEMLYLFKSRNQTLMLDIEPVSKIIEVDPERIRQVIVNFLDNAFKFTPAGGSVIFRVKSLDDKLLFEVEDNGLGIPDDEKDKIFRSYYSRKKADNPHTGIGVGLTLAKMLIELHGGEIGVRSADGQGSVFYFSLPLEKRAGK